MEDRAKMRKEINGVREVVYGNKAVDPDAFLWEIADNLSKKPVDSKLGGIRLAA